MHGNFGWIGNTGLVWRYSILTRSPWCPPSLWHVGRTVEGETRGGLTASWRGGGRWPGALTSSFQSVSCLAHFRASSPWTGEWSLESHQSMRGRLTLQVALAPSGSAASHEACSAYRLAGLLGLWARLWYLQLWPEPLALLSPSVLQTEYLALLLAGTYLCLRCCPLTYSCCSPKPSESVKWN